MYIIMCDECGVQSKGSDSVILPEGWALVETKGEGFSFERLHLCPECRENLIVDNPDDNY